MAMKDGASTVHIMDCLWLTKLTGQDGAGYNFKSAGTLTTDKAMQRWHPAATCIVSMERIIVPVHDEQAKHWAAACVHPASSTIVYYDSMSRGMGDLVQASSFHYAPACCHDWTLARA